MGYFYVDESIHERGGFILGACVYSKTPLEELVNQSLISLGLKPGSDEYKSSYRMQGNDLRQRLRIKIKDILLITRIGLFVMPVGQRDAIALEGLKALEKIIEANELGSGHSAYFDEGILFPKIMPYNTTCKIFVNQDSKKIGGIQVADCAAHTMSIMLLEEMKIIDKNIKAKPNSGYAPEFYISIGFELWASIRSNFFTQDTPNLELEQHEGFNLDTASYALHIADSCDAQLRAAVLSRFATNYIGCIH